MAPGDIGGMRSASRRGQGRERSIVTRECRRNKKQNGCRRSERVGGLEAGAGRTAEILSIGCRRVRQRLAIGIELDGLETVRGAKDDRICAVQSNCRRHHPGEAERGQSLHRQRNETQQERECSQCAPPSQREAFDHVARPSSFKPIITSSDGDETPWTVRGPLMAKPSPILRPRGTAAL